MRPIRFLKAMLRTDPHRSRVQRFQYWLMRKGLFISPFYLNLERSVPGLREDAFPDYRASFLARRHMKEMAALPDRHFSEQDLLERLRKGDRCLGILHHGQLVAFTWTDLQNCSSKVLAFKLKRNEAYLYDAFVIEACRGKGLALLMRHELYKALRKLGRTRVYSITETTNESAKRFKLKLDARPLLLGLHVDLWGKARFTLRLKTYPDA